MILTAALASLLFALWYPIPKRVNRYLWAQFFGSILYFSVNYWWGDKGLIYALTYYIVTAGILALVLAIVGEGMRTHQSSWKALGLIAVLMVTLARVTFIGLGHPPSFPQAFVIMEGCLLFGCGLALGHLSTYMEQTWLLRVLAVFWLAQAFFRVVVYLSEDWMHWNWRVPPFLGIAAFTLMGLCARRDWRQRVSSAATA